MRNLNVVRMLLVLGLFMALALLSTVIGVRGWSSSQRHLPRYFIDPPQTSAAASQKDQGLGVGFFKALDKNNLWTVGHFKTQDPFKDGSLILHSADGGRSWEVQLKDSERYFRDVYFVNPQIGWLCGDEGLILKSTDGGKSWRRQDTPTESDLDEIQFINPKVGWATGRDGEVLRSTDGGLYWSSHPIEVEGRLLYRLCFADDLNGWILGEKKYAYQSTDGGISWKSRGTELLSLVDKTGKYEAHFGSVKFISAKIGFISANIWAKSGVKRKGDLFSKAVVFKTEDAGYSWTVLFEKERTILEGEEFLSEKEMWIALQFDTMLHSEDGGKTWVEVSTFPKRANFQFADSKNGWARVDNGEYVNKPDYTIYYTNDGGRSWKKSELPRIKNQ